MRRFLSLMLTCVIFLCLIASNAVAVGEENEIQGPVYIPDAVSAEPVEASVPYYNEDDLYWLSRIIYAEAGGECFEGMVAVGNVVLNRVESEEFPDTVYEVVFDNAYGIQFSPAYYGSIYCTPSEDAIEAAKMAMDGVNVVGDSLYFNTTALVNSWASLNREFTMQIGNHNFYA